MSSPPGTIRRGNRLLSKTTRRVLPPAITDAPPETDEDAIMIPASISSSSEAQAYWNYIIDDARRNDRFSPSYSFLYAQCALTATRLEKEWLLFAKEDSVVPVFNRKGEQCGERENPRAGIIAKLQRNMMGFISQLGLSPRAVQFLFVPSSSGGGTPVAALETTATPVKPKNGQIELFR